MTTNDATDAAADSLLPEDSELANRLREAEETRQSLLANGWVWRGENEIAKALCHPDDREISIWFDPYTGEQLLSPKYVELLKERVLRDRESGGLPPPA